MHVVMVPDCLNTASSTEQLLTVLEAAPLHRELTLDFTSVRWICPYGAIVLWSICRYQAFLRASAVILRNLQPQLSVYLRRIDFFRFAGEAVSTDIKHVDVFTRDVRSWTVIEMLDFRSTHDICRIRERAKQIMANWPLDVQTLELVDRTILETTSNVVEHSEGGGLLTLQRYSPRRSATVQLAVGDLGIGIPRSVQKRTGTLALTPVGYIEGVVGDQSNFGGNSGGGLTWIRRAALATGGSVGLRSQTALVRVSPQEYRALNDRPYLPGTQVAVRLELPHGL